MAKTNNLGHSVLTYGQKVKLDPIYNPRVSSSLKRKHFKVVGFWYKGKLRKTDPTKNQDKKSYRSFSGVSIQDKDGYVYNVNRFQLKKVSKKNIKKDCEGQL